jgi:hypothetical protein
MRSLASPEPRGSASRARETAVCSDNPASATETRACASGDGRFFLLERRIPTNPSVLNKYAFGATESGHDTLRGNARDLVRKRTRVCDCEHDCGVSRTTRQQMAAIRRRMWVTVKAATISNCESSLFLSDLVNSCRHSLLNGTHD